MSPRRRTEAPAPGAPPALRGAWRLALSSAAATAVVIGGPVVGALRGALLDAWPRAYVPVLAAIVAAGAAGLLGAAAYRLRGAAWSRVATVAGAATVAVACAVSVRTGDANVDVVEAFHFVEYGGLAILLAWAFEPVVGGTAIWWAVLAGVCVGVADEWFQWFVPGRTGEIRDVGLNAVAVGCGAAVARALHVGHGRAAPGHIAALGWGSAITLVAVTGLFATVHLGHEVTDASGRRFLSRSSRDALRRLADARSRQWGTGRLPSVGRFGREDQYLSEALWHVRRRNDALDHHEYTVAAREHAILQGYFAPVLQVAGPGGAYTHALPPEREETMRRHALADGAASDANPLPIYPWSAGAVWSTTTVLGLALVGMTRWLDRYRM